MEEGMAKELPYLPSYKNVEELFRKIASAKQPDAFTTRFLSDTLGLKSTGDRQLIALLKTLGFLDATARPTKDYGVLKNPAEAKRAIGRAIRRAYEPLFAANESAHALPASDLRGLVAQVAGTESGVTSKIVGTLNALAKIADMTSVPTKEAEEKPADSEAPPEEKSTPAPFAALRPEFHYNIQVHLPSNADEETYLHIFNALRKAFK